MRCWGMSQVCGAGHPGVTGVGTAQHAPRHGQWPQVDAQQRVAVSVGDYVVQDSEVIEHFQGAGLDTLGARSVRAVVGRVDDAPMPRRMRSMASVVPTGPAPTIRTSVDDVSAMWSYRSV